MSLQKAVEEALKIYAQAEMDGISESDFHETIKAELEPYLGKSKSGLLKQPRKNIAKNKALNAERILMNYINSPYNNKASIDAINEKKINTMVKNGMGKDEATRFIDLMDNKTVADIIDRYSWVSYTVFYSMATDNVDIDIDKLEYAAEKADSLKGKYTTDSMRADEFVKVYKKVSALNKEEFDKLRLVN